MESMPTTQNLGFFNRLGRGWKMTKLGMSVVRADPELMVYTFFSLLLSLIAGLVVVSGTVGLDVLTETSETSQSEEDAILLIHLAITFVGYLIISVITVFWNSAIIASAHERLSSGSNPSFSYGIKQAMKCLPSIFAWGLISGTVGVILKILESTAQDQKSPLAAVAMITSFLLGAAWWMLTFFVIPSMILDKNGVFDSMKKSPKLFKSTWGENAGATGGIGLIQFFTSILAVLICLPLFFLGDYGIITGIILITFIFGLVTLFFTTVDSVNRASLFYYAKTGEMPPMAEKMGIIF
jgi:hypothetical protein